MSRQSRRDLERYWNQTDSQSKRLHKRSKETGEIVRGIAVFVNEPEGGEIVQNVEADIDYDSALAAAEEADLFKWVAHPVMAEHKLAIAEGRDSESIGRGDVRMSRVPALERYAGGMPGVE